MNAPRDVSHDEAVVAMLKADPDFANEYLAAALEEAQLPGGQVALLGALRHIAEAQGMSAVAAIDAVQARINAIEMQLEMRRQAAVQAPSATGAGGSLRHDRGVSVELDPPVRSRSQTSH